MYLLFSVVTVGIITVLSGNNILTLLFSVLIFTIRAYVRVIQGKMNDPDLPGQIREVELWEISTILDEPKVYHWVVYVVLYFGIIFLKQNDLLKWMFLLLLAEIFVTYIFGSLSQIKNYVVENCHIAHLPVQAMKRMQKAVLGITLAVLTAVILPAVFYGEEPLTRLAELELHMNVNLEEDVLDSMPMMQDSGKALEEMFGVEQQEPNVILEMIFQILAHIFMIFGSIVGVYAVWHICRKMMNSFEMGQESDEVIYLDEGESLTSRIRRAARRSEKQSIRQKIRKMYKKTIKKNLKGKPTGWETPEELEEKAGLRGRENGGDFHEIYEKARYSRGECDEEDLKKINAYVKGEYGKKV